MAVPQNAIADSISTPAMGRPRKVTRSTTANSIVKESVVMPQR
jgi:hypothetical protein